MTVAPEILKLWQQYSSATFPEGYGNKQIHGIDLSLLDAEIASCIYIYMNNSAELDARRARILRERLIDLNNVVLFMEGEELSYFNRLRELANLILQEAGR